MNQLFSNLTTKIHFVQEKLHITWKHVIYAWSVAVLMSCCWYMSFEFLELCVHFQFLCVYIWEKTVMPYSELREAVLVTNLALSSQHVYIAVMLQINLVTDQLSALPDDVALQQKLSRWLSILCVCVCVFWNDWTGCIFPRQFGPRKAQSKVHVGKSKICTGAFSGHLLLGLTSLALHRKTLLNFNLRRFCFQQVGFFHLLLDPEETSGDCKSQ